MKTGTFGRLPESALGAGGPRFKSARPDQLFQQFTAIFLAVAKPAVVEFVAVDRLKPQLRTTSRTGFWVLHVAGTNDTTGERNLAAQVDSDRRTGLECPPFLMSVGGISV